MSYILAALKKADQEHFLGSVPDLATPQEVQPAEPRSFRWQWVIVALLVVNTALVVLLLKNRGTEVATAPDVGQTALAEPVSSPDMAPVPPEPRPTLPVNDRPIQPAAQTGAEQASTAPVLEKISAPAVEAPSRASGNVVILPETARTQTTELSLLPDEVPDTPVDGTVAFQGESQLQSWFELPQAFRNNLDLPRLDVHVYSETPQASFIMVNLKKYREGQTLPNGMLLEEILPDGMVMSYQGERFRVDK